MIIKRFTITSVFLGDVRSITKNQEQALAFLNVIFRGDNRYTKAKKYISKMELNDDPFTILSPAGSIKVIRIK